MLPVLFLHALTQTPQAWQDQVVALPPGTPMLAPWLSGLRPGDTSGFDLDTAVDKVQQELQARGFEQIRVCAQGLGVSLAVRLAAQRPELVDRMLLAGPTPRLSRTGSGMLRFALRAMPSSAYQHSSEVKQRVLEAIAGIGRIDIRPDLPLVQAPTLVLVGESDRAATAGAAMLTAGLPQAEVRRLRGGALLNFDNPAGFNELMVGFLAD